MTKDNLDRARARKDDEFYTTYETVEKELCHYSFKGLRVYCPCDGEQSAFWKYFYDSFHSLGLKVLVATELNGLYIRYDGVEVIRSILNGGGDFRSEECISILKESDVIITNPPFSLMREFLNLIYKYRKKFLVIGSQNVITYKETALRLVEGVFWTGVNYGDMAFRVPPDSEPRETRFWVDESGQKWRSFGNLCWFTNLEHDRRNQPLLLSEIYSESKYSKYDHYDAIEVSKVSLIPRDYDGVMGVPITFLFKWNPEQFDVMGTSRYHDGSFDEADDIAVLNGKTLYMRILIRKKNIKVKENKDLFSMFR